MVLFCFGRPREKTLGGDLPGPNLAPVFFPSLAPRVE